METIKIWHVWSSPTNGQHLESFVEMLTADDSLLICSAEESYYPARQLIEKTVPYDDTGWPQSFGNYNKFKKNLSKLKSVKIIIGSDDSKVIDSYLDIGAVYSWSNFFLYRAISKLNDNELSDNTFKKLFLSMNTKAHYHRCELMDLLSQYNLLESGIYSWHNHPTRKEDGVYKWKSWFPTVVNFDVNYDANNLSRVNQQHHLPSEFSDVFVILVAETYIDQIFITEKTWHPILVEKPFLVYSAPGFYKRLLQYGIELYDEIFDYAFDNELDDTMRATMICKELLKIKDLDLSMLHDKIKHKLTKNKQCAYNLVKQKIGVPSSAFEFEQYKKLLEDVS
jgi:hypothetical protein